MHRSTPVTPLPELAHRLDADQPLALEEALWLYQSADLFTLGTLANRVRERKHGRRTYYNVNRHINYSNYCVLRCKFCSFYRAYPAGRTGRSTPRGDELPPETAEDRLGGGGYEYSVEEIVQRAQEAYVHGATEVHIVGGLHPKLPFEFYEEMVRGIRSSCPRLHIKAFTAIEVIHFTRVARPRLTIEQVLTRLRDAGVGSLPGGGAEIFDDRVHDEAFRNKVGEAEWFEVHRAAHELGMFTNATMLYGHVETPEERVRHLMKLRDHQAESLRSRAAHFNCVIPLSFVPDHSALSQLPGPDGITDLRTLAITRLICTNIPHVKAFWIMLTPKLAQVSLDWGVDDVDGTVVYYDITKREGRGTTHQELTVDGLKRFIVEARCEPVERDTLYRRVLRTPGRWQVEGEPWWVECAPNRDALPSTVEPVLVPLSLGDSDAEKHTPDQVG